MTLALCISRLRREEHVMRQRVDGWMKRNDRQPVDLPAVVFRGDGTRLEVRLSNMSFEGCQLECDETLQIGELIKVALPGLGEIGAQVRWALPGRAGACFLLDETRPGERRARLGA
jgi:hypothetical protein